MVRLFKAYSVVKQFLGQDQVTFNWFAVGRPAPILPYEQLIQDFDENDDESCYDKMFVDELLTIEEVAELKKYLWDHHEIEIQKKEIAFPVKPGQLSSSLLLISGDKGFYSLADEEDYQLSISILGHFKYLGTEDHRGLSEEDIQNGIRFLLSAFRNLDIAEMEETKVAQFLNNIYAEQGFFVQKDSKNNEGIKSNSKNNRKV